MLRWFRRRTAPSPCPVCARPVGAEAEKCDGCGRRVRPPRAVPLRILPDTDLRLSAASLDNLSRRD